MQNDLEPHKKSKKPRRCFALAEFVVIKKKCKKTNKLTFKKLHVVKSREFKGVVKRAKKSTLKKKILIARTEKREQQQVIQEITSELEDLDVKEGRVIRHSNSFREYCDHFITQEIRNLSITIIKDLLKFQENKFKQNPIKAKAHRRYVVGFQEVKKFLVVEKLKIIFIAPDLERNVEVDKLVDDIKALATENKSLLIFSIPRRKLGYLLLKKVPVSVVGVFDFQGTTENVNSLISLVEHERLNYNKSFIST